MDILINALGVILAIIFLIWIIRFPSIIIILIMLGSW